MLGGDLASEASAGTAVAATEKDISACAQVGSQYRDWAVPAGQVQGDKWVPNKNQAGKTLAFAASGGKPPGPYCRRAHAACSSATLMCRPQGTQV